MKGLFITGTDTAVGKTTVACALAAAFRAEGHTVATLKPVETGCLEGPLGLIPEDALRLALAAGEPVSPARSLAEICPNRFALPASPEAAAAAEGREVDLAAIAAAVRARAATELLLVEGAGGLLVPLGPRLLQVDLAARLGYPVVVVGRAALGTINHTLLTVEAARRRGLQVAGVVLNRSAGGVGPEDASNAPAIAHHGAVRVLGTFPFAPGAEPAAAAALAREHLDLQALWRAL